MLTKVVHFVANGWKWKYQDCEGNSLYQR